MKILQIGNPILETKTEQVSSIQKPKVQSLIKVMTEYLLEDKSSIGLAAPQIGEDLSICVVKKITTSIENEEEVKVVHIISLINPKIIYKSEIEEYLWEGCLSVGIGSERLFGPVKRSNRVKVKYLDQKGKQRILEAEGFFAHVVQHEVDHLNGVLFLRHIVKPENIWRSEDLDEYLKEHDEYPPISETGYQY